MGLGHLPEWRPDVRRYEEMGLQTATIDRSVPARTRDACHGYLSLPQDNYDYHRQSSLRRTLSGKPRQLAVVGNLMTVNYLTKRRPRDKLGHLGHPVDRVGYHQLPLA